jgi:hypothetical protein
MQLEYLNGDTLKTISLQHGNRVQFNHQGDFYIKVTFVTRAGSTFERSFSVLHTLLDPNSLYTILTGMNCNTNKLHITFNNGQLPIRIVEQQPSQ